VPHVKVIGGTRVLDQHPQKIFSIILHRYRLEADASLRRAPSLAVPDAEEGPEQAKVWARLSALEAEGAALQEALAALSEHVRLHTRLLCSQRVRFAEAWGDLRS
jgi:hypothetical protein